MKVKILKKLFAEGQTRTGIRPKLYHIELEDPSWKIRLRIFRIVDAMCKYVLFTGDEVRRDPSGHLGLIHSVRSAQVRSKGAASKYLSWLSMPQRCGTVTIFYGSGSGSDF